MDSVTLCLLFGPHSPEFTISRFQTSWIQVLKSRNLSQTTPVFAFKSGFINLRIIYFMQENYCQLKIRPFKRTRKGMEPAINKFQLHTKTLTSVFQCNRAKFLPTTL